VLPAGTVTLLLTDVEGSTRLWQERSGEMAEAIASHYEILDAAIAQAEGVRPVEQGEGDSVVGAFTRVADAVTAAVTAQRRLRVELPWLPVRMALHTGDAQLRGEGNYVGSSIIRCARLRACGHGGQILVSETTAAVAADGVADDIGLIDLGVTTLRDFARPERVWQLSHPDLPSAFPPLRSIDAAPHNLPAALTSLIGRDVEIAAVAELVRRDRLVTLTGAGGCGKTRLAQHVAAELVDAYPGGTWWVELAPIEAGAQVADRVAGATGLIPTPDADVAPQLVRHLMRMSSVLVVLDNAEHVVADVARLVQEIISGCPAARLLVTSREALGVPGETVRRVPSLAAPAPDEAINLERLVTYDAVRLFLERAGQGRPNLVVDERTAPHIAAICARLDGIPLALELAAARARTLPLDRLAAGLDDAFRLLTGGARTVLPRQQTLHASIAWSVDLLDDTEATVLRRLAVFHGSFTVDAAEAVAADSETVDAFVVLDVIGSLVDKSLVQLDDETDRFRLLDTIRQFGLRRLRDIGELAATRQRHSRWFAEWCVRTGRGDHGLTFDPSDEALPDVLAALDWAYEASPADAYRMCRGLGWVRIAVGHSAEFARQYDWVAARDGTDDPAGWATAVAGLALGAIASVRLDFLDLLARAEPLLDPQDHATRRLARSFPAHVALMVNSDGDELELLAASAARDGDDFALRQCAASLAIQHTREGHFTEAHQDINQVRALLDRRGLPFTMATGHAAFATAMNVLYEEGRLSEACEMANIGGPAEPGTVFIAAGVTATLGYLTGDRDLIARAQTMQDREVPVLMRSPALAVQYLAALDEDRQADALDLIRRSYAGFPMTAGLKSFILRPLVVSLLQDRLADEAREHLEPFAEDVDRIGRPPLPVAHLHQIRALLAHYDGRDDTALEEAHALLTLASSSGFMLLTIDALELLGTLAAGHGHSAVAARLLGAAAAHRDRIGYVARIVPDPPAADAIVDQLRTDAATAFTEGTALNLDLAVEYARRSRGERTRPTHGWASLTPTEREVAGLVADGLTNDNVAKRLLMSPATVKTHLTHIYAKTGIVNRTELARRFRPS
jgi:predicted ATPase/class 3 adenylate cyclase/DNA-binding CsgD family transcriptional regulator